MPDMMKADARRIREQPRFRGIFKDGGSFKKRLLFASPNMYGDENDFVEKAWETGFSGENITGLEQEIAEFVGIETAVAFSSGTAAVHAAVKLAAKQLYASPGGSSVPNGLGRGGSLRGKRVLCSDFTSSAMVNPVIYEGGEPVFIDCSEDDWCMDPEVLKMAFKIYPDVRLVIMNHAYGFPGQIQQIQRICREHGALLIEDASESLGAKVWVSGDSENYGDGWRQTGSFGDYGILDFADDKIITGSCGGMLLFNNSCCGGIARDWVSGEKAGVLRGWQEELESYDRMSDVAAGIIRGQLRHLDEHIARKRKIYERYCKKLDGGLIGINPAGIGTEPNYWRSCMTCESNIQFMETRSERSYTYTDQHGTAAPMEICDALEAFGAEGRPVYKPMSMQPIFKNNDQITLEGSRRECGWFRNDSFWVRSNVARENFDRGLCLPCDIKMSEEEQDRVIDIVFACFNRIEMDRMMWV